MLNIINPKLILTGIDKEYFFSCNLFRIIKNIGHNKIINNGFNDKNHSVGIVKPATVREIKLL